MTWNPQPGPQTSALLADWVPELFYGGERGGGKSDFQLGYQEDGALRYGKAHRGIMFRKTYAELEELQARARSVFVGAVYKTQPSADYPFSNCWYWPNGASVKMRYIERETDYGRYHGHQYSSISFDEVTEYATPAGLLKMLSTLRSAHNVPCTVRLTGNPGGKGHGWVKTRYIDVAPPMTPYTDPESGMVRMFIPSRLADNPILLGSDPDYRSRLIASTSGNEALRKAWLEGDWDIVAGAFFNCWDRSKHVIKPFNVPKSWSRFRSFDWGSSHPFSVHWWAIAGDDDHVPRGAIVCYREWYGASEPNVGLKLSAEQVAAGIVSRDAGEKFVYSVADPSCWKVDGGPSIAERMHKSGVVFMRADNQRINGWDQVRQRMIGADKPMLYLFDTCRDSIRTIPLMQHGTDIEDIDTDLEDHCVDSIRYACMSRPWLKPIQTKPQTRFPAQMTINEMIAAHRRRNEDR